MPPFIAIFLCYDCRLPRGFGVKSKEQAVSENFEAFEKQLPQLLQAHAGKYALLRDKKVVEFFDSVGDAVKYGRDNFPDSLYSVQLVTQEVEDLGYFSHAVP
jgi:hypothetical protein